MNESTGVGPRIRAHREALSMSQEELARACFVSRQTISSWENGKTLPDIQSLASLANIFDIALEDLADPDEKLTATRRVSADRKELQMLWADVAAVAILFLPVEQILQSTGTSGHWRLPTYLAFGIVTLAIIIRIGMLTHKHHLGNDQEIGAYMSGTIKKGSADRAPEGTLKAFLMRHYFAMTIVLGVLFWFALDFVCNISDSPWGTIGYLAAWIAMEILLEWYVTPKRQRKA